MNLNEIQKALKAPKNQRNNFGNYNYRSCEDILEAVKPLLEDSVLTLSDEIVEMGGRVYVKARADFWNEKENVTVTAYAREAQNKKGMDESQITGAASSYARKYALNGLFLIDDTKDADTMDNTEPVSQTVKTAQSNRIDFNVIDKELSKKESKQQIIDYINSIQGLSDKQKAALDNIKNKHLKKLDELSFDNQLPIVEV